MVAKVEKIKKDDIDLGVKKESGAAETLTDAVTGILTSVLKIKDLRGAMVELNKAQQLKDSGDKVGAKKLSLAVFDRLKQVGENVEDLPEKLAVQALVKGGNYAELAKIIEEKRKEIDASGQAGLWKTVVDKTKNIEDSLKGSEKKRKSAEVTKDEAAMVSLPKETAEIVRDSAIDLSKLELDLSRRVQERVEQLTVEVGAELDKTQQKDLLEKWEEVKIEMSFAGRSEVSLEDVVIVREKMGEIWKEALQSGQNAALEAKKGAKEVDKSTKIKINKFEKLLKENLEDKGWSIAVAGRTKELAGVLGGIEKKLRMGLSFEQICEDLKPNEIGSIQQWMRSLGKKKGQIGYDPVISEISEEVLKDEGGRKLLFRFMANVQIRYDEAQWRRTEEEMGSRGFAAEDLKGRVMRGEPLLYDGDQPHFGLREGMSGTNRSGREFLGAVSGDVDYVHEWLLKNASEAELLKYKQDRANYRAEMMNVSFEALKNDKDVPQELKDYLDFDAFTRGEVVGLKKEFRNNPEARARFQALWLQEMLYAQRLIAYEGVFQNPGAHQDARVTRYNTLMSIMDVSTELKGVAKFQGQMFSMVDMQQNSFLDEEALSALVKPWTSQGPDFRLEHLLKVHRENIYVQDKKGKRINIGDISTYDVVHKLKMRVENADERAALGITGNISRHYGTMMERFSDEEKRGEARKVIFFSLLKDIGVDVGKLDTEQKNWVYTRYQSYLDEGINYMFVHKELHQAIGNASLNPNEYKLPQGLPEMLYKSDPKLVMDYFRIYSVGGASKDAFVVGDSGMRDHITMAMPDYGNHLFFAETTTQGAVGIRDAFFAGRNDAKSNEYVAWMGKTMKESIFHNGYHDSKRPVTLSTKMGDHKEITSGTRLPDAEVIDNLLKAKPPAGFVEAIDWGTKDNPGVFAKIVVDPKLVRQLTSNELNPQQKWDLFIRRYGEDYYNMQSAGAKRMDHMTKYGLGSHFTWYKAYLDWQSAVVNNTKAIEAMKPASAVNATIVPHLVNNFLEYQTWANEKLGWRIAGGGKTERVKKDASGKIQFDTKYGFLGEDASGCSEWPGMDSEPLVNDSKITDPIQNRSVNSASGVAGYEDEFAMKNLAEDFFHAGMMTENTYNHWYKEDFVKSFFWAKKKGILPNLWNWATGEVFFEYMGNVWFGIPGHMLREAWTEPTKEELSHLWKYFSGGGGH